MRHLSATLPDEAEAGVVAFAADVAAHASLVRLTLLGAPLSTAAAIDAVVDAALARRMDAVALSFCGLSPASAPALARLLSSDALTTLECSHTDLLDVPAATLLAAALRENSTLTSLTLIVARVWEDLDAAAELLGALTGHASLRVLNLACNRLFGPPAEELGAVLGTLVAANAPALTELDLSNCILRDAGLRPLFEALPGNTHLRKLECEGNIISDAFERDVVLPAVHANASLRELDAGRGAAHATQAAALVRDRR